MKSAADVLKMLKTACARAFRVIVGTPKNKDSITAKDYYIIPLAALAVAVVIRTLVFDNFHIPSASMEDTLLVGDKITVSKSAYGYGRYSFPFGLIPFKGRLLKKEPQRGDIVVFKLPSNKRINYVKRLIGIPGDEVRVTAGTLYINDVAVPRRYLSPERFPELYKSKPNVKKYLETLPNGVEYIVLDEFYDEVSDDTATYTVPEGHYFFLGDNRDRSRDSRFHDVGFIHEDLLLGRVKFVMISSPYSLLNIMKWGQIRMGRLFLDPNKVQDKIQDK